MTKFKHLFLNLLPPIVEPDTLYISMEYGTVVHLCACGCGRRVVTPLSPRDWKLTFDGASVTLSPSIGNWQYPCRSHYWIRNSRVEWAYNSDNPANILGDPQDPPRHLSAISDIGTSGNDNSCPSVWQRLKRRWKASRSS